jgi:hypothetical protein
MVVVSVVVAVVTVLVVPVHVITCIRTKNMDTRAPREHVLAADSAWMWL